jgi:hypothetical protein
MRGILRRRRHKQKRAPAVDGLNDLILRVAVLKVSTKAYNYALSTNHPLFSPTHWLEQIAYL